MPYRGQTRLIRNRSGGDRKMLRCRLYPLRFEMYSVTHTFTFIGLHCAIFRLPDYIFPLILNII